MNHYIAEPGDLLPRNFGMGRADLRGDPLRGFAEDGELPDNRILAESSLRNAAPSTPWAWRWIRRQAFSMSSSQASSFHIEGFRVRENVAAADLVLAAFDRGALYEVHLAPEQRCQFRLDRYQISPRPRRVRCEGHEQVEVAVGTKVRSQDGAEEGQLSNPPSPAEEGERGAGHQIADRVGSHAANCTAGTGAAQRLLALMRSA